MIALLAISDFMIVMDIYDFLHDKLHEEAVCFARVTMIVISIKIIGSSIMLMIMVIVRPVSLTNLIVMIMIAIVVYAHAPSRGPMPNACF